MIKLVCFFRRKPGMSAADFHAHWRDQHGPLIADTPELAQHLVRYEQNHRLASDYARDAGGSPGFDGATVQWLESMEGFLGFVREPKYAELIAPDEARFLDRESLTLLFTEDDDVKIEGDREAADVKLLALLRRKPGRTAPAFQRHWGGRHASIFADTPEIARHIVAYHQSRRLTEDYARDRDGQPGFDGLAEQWYAALSDFEQMVREPSYSQRVPADEEHFIDRPAIEFLISGPPDVIIGGQAARDGLTSP